MTVFLLQTPDFPATGQLLLLRHAFTPPHKYSNMLTKQALKNMEIKDQSIGLHAFAPTRNIVGRIYVNALVLICYVYFIFMIVYQPDGWLAGCRI